ncbi:hypothetical protein XENTR_v10023499 [Xenopus tropicalis]|nr:hypothetical protein XENTR_v10023499 [Xenopus tropicalis]
MFPIRYKTSVNFKNNSMLSMKSIIVLLMMGLTAVMAEERTIECELYKAASKDFVPCGKINIVKMVSFSNRIYEPYQVAQGNLITVCDDADKDLYWDSITCCFSPDCASVYFTTNMIYPKVFMICSEPENCKMYQRLRLKKATTCVMDNCTIEVQTIKHEFKITYGDLN